MRHNAAQKGSLSPHTNAVARCSGMTAARLAALLAAAAAAPRRRRRRASPARRRRGVGTARSVRGRCSRSHYSQATGASTGAALQQPWPRRRRARRCVARDERLELAESSLPHFQRARDLEDCEMEHLHDKGSLQGQQQPEHFTPIRAICIDWRSSVYRCPCSASSARFTGYDLEELTSAHRIRAFGAATAATATKYSSQLVKLWSVFFDIVRRRRHWSLVFEDDAIAQPTACGPQLVRLLHGAGHNATSLPPAWHQLVSPDRPRLVPCGFQRATARTSSTWRASPTRSPHWRARAARPN